MYNFKNIKEGLLSGVVGLNDELEGAYIDFICKNNSSNILVVTSTVYEANKLYNTISNYTNNVYLFPMDDFIISMSSIASPEFKMTRLETINEIISNDNKKIIITNLMGYLRFLPLSSTWKNKVVNLKVGEEINKEELFSLLCSTGYERETLVTKTGEISSRGYILDVFPIGYENAIRIEFFGDEIDRITEIDYVTGKIVGTRNHVVIFPASHYVTTPERVEKAVIEIEKELEERVKSFKDDDKLLEAQRIEQRTKYDIEMLKEIGFCQGIENYSRHITGRKPGEKPYTLMDFFPDDYLIIVDESHVTVPQVRGMYAGDRSRKTSLIDNGFRLPSAYDNRPLNFDEFEENINQILFVTATPGSYELEHSTTIAEQIIRPTGLLDPIVEVRPINNQIDDLVVEINKVIEKDERVLITTLTKKMSEDLTNYLKEIGIKVKYLHSDIDTLERVEIIRDLRLGKFDVLVGINLLREGLDIPEVSLVAILDADKEGFLRSETSLIQTIGRAARNSEGKVIMYADKITRSMESAIAETKRRREIQMLYNEEHNITPTTIKKKVRDAIEATVVADEETIYGIKETDNVEEIKENIAALQAEMMEAAQNLQFERAAELRDKIKQLEERING